jgi:NAD(P)-dependent dehydrogenase (short-subunit alcohol dehydrogenase family)
MRLSHQFESAKSPDDERVLFVNNAAIINLYPAQITTQDRIRRDVESSITSPIAAMSAFIHAYPKGEVVNITSSCLETPFQHWGIYTASKAAIEAYLKVLQAEGYKTHNLNPGAMDTGMQDYIRSVDFPGVEQFKAMKAEGKLKDSKQVATAFVWKLEKSSGE